MSNKMVERGSRFREEPKPELTAARTALAEAVDELLGLLVDMGAQDKDLVQLAALGLELGRAAYPFSGDAPVDYRGLRQDFEDEVHRQLHRLEESWDKNDNLGVWRKTGWVLACAGDLRCLAPDYSPRARRR